MSEENRHPGAEISEAKLEGVSGGIGRDKFEERAYDICYGCGWDGKHCDEGFRLLAAYLKKNGIDSVNKGNYKSKCPYRIR